MTISVVLRLAPVALRAGRLAGEAEVVATGRRVVIRDADELIALLQDGTESSVEMPPSDLAANETSKLLPAT